MADSFGNTVIGQEWMRGGCGRGNWGNVEITGDEAGWANGISEASQLHGLVTYGEVRVELGLGSVGYSSYQGYNTRPYEVG